MTTKIIAYKNIENKENNYFRRFCDRCHIWFRPSGRKSRICEKCKIKIKKDMVKRIYGK